MSVISLITPLPDYMTDKERWWPDWKRKEPRVIRTLGITFKEGEIDENQRDGDGERRRGRKKV